MLALKPLLRDADRDLKFDPYYLTSFIRSVGRRMLKRVGWTPSTRKLSDYVTEIPSSFAIYFRAEARYFASLWSFAGEINFARAARRCAKDGRPRTSKKINGVGHCNQRRRASLLNERSNCALSTCSTTCSFHLVSPRLRPPMHEHQAGRLKSYVEYLTFLNSPPACM